MPRMKERVIFWNLSEYVVGDSWVIRWGFRRSRRRSKLRLPSSVVYEPAERDEVGDLRVFTR